VALHAGAAAALLVGQRRVIAGELRSFDVRRAAVLMLSFAPAALVGYTLERPIERHLGGPRTTAIGLLAGAAAMVVADRRPQRRGRGEATTLDGLALGIAQAAALAPGVSRNGATLAAARWRCFTREQANLLSRTVALPIIVGAAVLKGSRLHGRGTRPLAAQGDEGRRRRVIRLCARLSEADPPGRARPRPLALCRRTAPRWPRSCSHACGACAGDRRLRFNRS